MLSVMRYRLCAARIAAAILAAQPSLAITPAALSPLPRETALIHRTAALAPTPGFVSPLLSKHDEALIQAIERHLALASNGLTYEAVEAILWNSVSLADYALGFVQGGLWKQYRALRRLKVEGFELPGFRGTSLDQTTVELRALLDLRRVVRIADALWETKGPFQLADVKAVAEVATTLLILYGSPRRKVARLASVWLRSTIQTRFSSPTPSSAEKMALILLIDLLRDSALSPEVDSALDLPIHGPVVTGLVGEAIEPWMEVILFTPVLRRQLRGAGLVLMQNASAFKNWFLNQENPVESVDVIRTIPEALDMFLPLLLGASEPTRDQPALIDRLARLEYGGIPVAALLEQFWKAGCPSLYENIHAAARDQADAMIPLFLNRLNRAPVIDDGEAAIVGFDKSGVSIGVNAPFLVRVMGLRAAQTIFAPELGTLDWIRFAEGAKPERVLSGRQTRIGSATVHFQNGVRAHVRMADHSEGSLVIPAPPRYDSASRSVVEANKKILRRHPKFENPKYARLNSEGEILDIRPVPAEDWSPSTHLVAKLLPTSGAWTLHGVYLPILRDNEPEWVPLSSAWVHSNLAQALLELEAERRPSPHELRQGA